VSFFSPPAVATAFRAVAIAEACSWAGLLIGMVFKYLVVGNEIGVHVFGPVHGALFVAYVVVTSITARTFGWRRPTTLLGLACSLPPFATLWFEHRQRPQLSAPHGSEPHMSESHMSESPSDRAR
jgi:integral membrane protein